MLERSIFLELFAGEKNKKQRKETEEKNKKKIPVNERILRFSVQLNKLLHWCNAHQPINN